MMKKQKEEIIQKPVERYFPTTEDGLSASQVEERILDNLTNNIPKGSSKSILHILYKNIFTFFNMMYIIIFILLLSAGADVANFMFVLIVGANTLIGVIQEVRSKQTIDKLSLLSAPHVTVVRDGEKREIKVEEIVLDDIMYLASGDEITTDAIFVSGDIEVNESQLTGESVPIRKQPGDMLYSGSFVVSGHAYAKVEHVGRDNETEKLASQAKQYS
jgi:cation-transporting ATPase E